MENKTINQMNSCNCTNIFKWEVQGNTHKLCGGIINEDILDKLISIKPKKTKQEK